MTGSTAKPTGNTRLSSLRMHYMKMSYSTLVAISLLLLHAVVFSQQAPKKPHSAVNNYASVQSILMPYNRLIHSAGVVVTYGDSSLENHALDLCLLPNKKSLVVLDRYGIAILNARTKKITYRWNYGKQNELKDLVSSYS